MYVRETLHLLKEICTVPRQPVWDGVLTSAKEIPSEWKDFHGMGLIKDSFMEEVNLEHALGSIVGDEKASLGGEPE